MRKLAWILAAAFAALALFLIWHHRAPATRPQGRPRTEAARAARVTITFVGDILLASGAGRIAAQQGTESLFAGVGQMLRDDDLTIGNFECSAATCGTRAKKKYTFRAAPALLRGLRAAGIDAVSLANNHSMDYGRAALLETVEHLRSANLPSAGAGADLRQAYEPAILTAGPHEVALLAASRVLPTGDWCAGVRRPGIAAAYDPSPLLAAIRAARPRAAIVLVYLHWGKERAPRPQQHQRALARRCIEAGADLIVGAHPHVLQGFEYYRGKLIAYSLGNFIFNNRTKTTAMLQATFKDRALERATIIPCSIVNYRPTVITEPHVRQRVLHDLQARSFRLNIAENGALSPKRSRG